MFDNAATLGELGFTTRENGGFVFRFKEFLKEFGQGDCFFRVDRAGKPKPKTGKPE